ncbi:MAG TPA: S8 family serine peptidase, partial [Anaerolineae bacterium]|nr:S8 family serine peptidase [Anaerolineae bacterium]
MRIKWLNLLVLTAMVLGLFPVGVSAAPAADAPVIVEVEPALRQQLQADEGTGYLIYFHERPDLSKAYAMDWITRGRFVTAALQATAERSQARVRAYLDAQGADYQAFWIDNVIAVEKSNLKTFNTLTTAFPEVEALRAHRQLQLYEATETASPAMTSSAIEPNILHVLADQVWAEGYTGQGIVVASVDTGVRYTHDALVNHYRGNLGGGTFDHNYNWWDPYGNHPTAPGDDNGHGTHTMGTMVGDDGGANQIGMAPGAKWVACRGCNTSSCTDTALLECAEFFAAPWDLTGANANPDKRPNAVNNSWGDCSTSYDPWYQGVVDAWHAAGIYPVFSNGNASNCGYPAPPGLNTVGNPARYGNVTGVGSSGRDNGQYATHSNWGPTDNPDTVNPKPGWADLKPQVLAPGVNIRSSVNSGDSAYQGGWSGTSMSAPHVTGLVALMWSAAPCLIGDYATTETLIEDTATPIPYDDGTGSGAHVPNYAAGWGEINALAAVEAAAASCGDSAIVGQVTDATTSAPIAGATVVATNEVAQRQATSNAEGLYALTVFSGTYTLTASRYGYQTTVIPDVSATTGTTTTQNIALTPAAMYEVSGKVTDATTGWPLYAHISISGDPVDPFPPDNSVWTNPATGEYSLMLAEGVTYTLEVEAWVDGYGVGTGEVGPLTADAPHTDFALQPDMVACTAPGYHFVGGLMANFEDKTFPPAGWTVVNNGGTCDWAGDDPGGRGNLTGGTGKFAVADSDACGSGSTMNTDLVSPPFDVSGLSQVNLSFAYDYNNYTAGEVAAVDVSANNGASWVNVVTWTTDQRGPATFSQNVTGILAGSTQARVRFHYYAPSWDWWWEVDNVVLGNPVCQAPTDGGLVVGNVYDANFPTLALNGATVVNATGGETTAKATPADAAVDDAFYTLFAPSGAQALTATMTGGYAPDTATVTVVDGGTVEQDFQLPAGLLEATPAGIATTVELGYADSATLTLANTGDANATFELKEHEGRFVPLHIEAYTGELQSDGAPVSTGLAPRKAASVGPVAPTASPLADAAPAFAIDLSTGDLGTFMSDAPGAWTDIGPVGLDGPFAGDFLGGDFSQMYVLDYYANTLYVVDTATGVATEIGTSTPQSGQVWTGMTGFVDGTLYAASTDGGQSYLYTVDPATGATTVVGEITNAPVIIDIAINADGEMYGVDIGSDVLVAIDPATGAGTVVGSLGYNANYAQGMDFEEESGVLYWAAYGTSGELRIIDTETGASTSVGAFPGGTEVDCLAFATGGTADVPWLTETPVSGNVPAQGNVPVTLGFDAAYVDQPGEYHAELIVKNDTPYGKFSVPVTMTVEAPTSWGQLTGTVTGLGVCDGDPAPLEEAEVVVESATTGQTWTLATDENGAYTLWLDQAHSPLTITVTAPDYFGETGGVVVKQGKTTVVDFNLRLLKPCLSYDPADFDVTLPMGNNTVEPLTLSNTGA